MNELNSAPHDIDVQDQTAKLRTPEQFEETRPASVKRPPLSQAFQGAFTAGPVGRFTVEGADQLADSVFPSMNSVFPSMGRSKAL